MAVLEAGRRFTTADYARTSWNLRRFLWAPAIGLRGIMRLVPFSDVFIAAGAGVGGGSLVYANQLLVPPDDVFALPEWGLDDCREVMMPHYEEARRMLAKRVEELKSVNREHEQRKHRLVEAEQTLEATVQDILES